MDGCTKQGKIMYKKKQKDTLHKASSILSVAAILLTIALFVRMETVVHDTKMMDSKFTLEIQHIKDALTEERDTRKSLVKEDSDVLNGIKYTANIIRRSLKTNHSDSDLDEVGDGLKRYVKSIVAEFVESYCLAPNKVCLAGSPGLKGNQGNRGKRGPKGTKGKKGKGIMGTPGEPGKQGIKGDVGTPGIKGEKGDVGTPGHPGPKGDTGESISAPEVIVSPTSLTVVQYQTATFYCSGDGNPKPSVSWSKTNGTGQGNKRGEDNKLQIRSAGYNDSGIYVCTATSVLGQAKKFVKLFVEVPPQFIEIPKSAVEVTANSETSLSCRVFGFPQPTVVWSRGLVPLPQGRTTVTNGTLKISNFSRRDAGPYQCKATNRLGSIKALTTLMYVQPDFWMRSAIITDNAFYQTRLHEFLTPAVGSNPRWVLCYRASTHGWAGDTFHRRCGGKRDTVTIIKNGEFVFGGYTDIPWGEFIPYDENLEPVPTEEEAAAYDENFAREEEEHVMYQRRFAGEVETNTWCKCSRCSIEAVTKAEECICCKEIDRVGEVMSQADLEDQCITLHPGFQDVCLNRWVLQIASLALKTKAGKSYRTLFSQGLKSESEFLRSVSYRQFTRLLWDFVGSSKRYPLPCCAYNAIRKAFPSENGQYYGFEED